MSLLVKLGSATFPSFEMVLSRSVVQWLGAYVWMARMGLRPFSIGNATPDQVDAAPRVVEVPQTTPESQQTSPSDEVSLLLSPRLEQSPRGFGATSSPSPPSPSPAPVDIRRWLLVRGFAGALGLASFYYSITCLPLSDATPLFFTGPPITALMAHWLLGEELTRLDVFSAAGCLLGVVLVARPSALFGNDGGEQNDNVNVELRAVGVFAALFGAFLSSLAYVTVRHITKLSPGLNALYHVYYFGMVSSIVSPLFMALFGQRFVTPPDFVQWMLLLGIGVTAFMGQLCLNRGLQLAAAGPGTLMRNLDVVFAFIFGVFILDERLKWTSVVGALMIIGCTVVVGVHKYLMRRRQNAGS